MILPLLATLLLAQADVAPPPRPPVSQPAAPPPSAEAPASRDAALADRRSLDDLVRRYVAATVTLADLRAERAALGTADATARAAEARQRSRDSLERTRLSAERDRLARTGGAGSLRAGTLDRQIRALDRPRLSPTARPVDPGARALDRRIVAAEIERDRLLALAAAYGDAFDAAVRRERARDVGATPVRRPAAGGTGTGG